MAESRLSNLFGGHQLPEGTRWAERGGCKHPTVEQTKRAELGQHLQKCACGRTTMGFRCPDCDRVY